MIRRWYVFVCLCADVHGKHVLCGRFDEQISTLSNKSTNESYRRLLSSLSSKCFVPHLIRFGFQSVLLIRFSRYCLHWSQVVENANQPNAQVNPSQVPFDGAYTKDSLYNRFQAIRKHSTCKNKWKNKEEKNIAEDKTHHSMNNGEKSDEVLVMRNKVGITRF